MAIFVGPGMLKKKKQAPWQADPSKLTTSTVRRQPSYVYDYKTGSPTQIRRQTTAQAAQPVLPTFSRGPFPPVSPSGRAPQTVMKPTGFDPAASQFPWQFRKGISSDVSRQRAFNYGFGSGEGRGGFARRATDVFFDPRYMFDFNFRNWELKQRLRRNYGL